jgi:hypothetical protein
MMMMQKKDDVQLITPARHDFKLSKTLQCPIYRKISELKDDIASDFDYEPTFRVGKLFLYLKI